jgi:predicted patatin/cPLA2 family phospholipase
MQFDQIVLAGGGNRCWWQAGFWNALNEAIPQHPTKIVAVSAGAATA